MAEQVIQVLSWILSDWWHFVGVYILLVALRGIRYGK